jgi:preprotein translocase subunit SecE
VTRSPAGRSGPRGAFLSTTSKKKLSIVAKVSPGEFIRQVRAETSKVYWPSRKETVATGIMVLIMSLLLAFFFFAVDAAFNLGVRYLLSFLG